MVDRTLILAENGRNSLRGVTQINAGEFEAYQDEDDALTYTIDLAPYLGSDTIASVTRTASGPTVANTSNTTTRIIQRLTGFGYVDIAATMTGGDVQQFRLWVKPRVNDRNVITNYV